MSTSRRAISFEIQVECRCDRDSRFGLRIFCFVALILPAQLLHRAFSH